MEIEHSTIAVKIQWGKEKIEFELDTNDDMPTFRGNFPNNQYLAKLYSMTFVPEQKQKIIFAGKTLKDDTVIADLKKLKPVFFSAHKYKIPKGRDFSADGLGRGQGPGPDHELHQEIRRRHDSGPETAILQRCFGGRHADRDQQPREHLLPEFDTAGV